MKRYGYGDKFPWNMAYMWHYYDTKEEAEENRKESIKQGLLVTEVTEEEEI